MDIIELSNKELLYFSKDFYKKVLKGYQFDNIANVIRFYNPTSEILKWILRACFKAYQSLNFDLEEVKFKTFYTCCKFYFYYEYDFLYNDLDCLFD